MKSKIKKVCALMLVVVMIVSMIRVNSVAASSDESIVSASDSRFSYCLDGEYASIIGYTGSDENLEIPDMLDGHIVKKIGRRVFEKNKAIKTVVIPDSVETIENSAFFECSNLKEVTFGKGVTNIEDYAFCKTGLTQVRLPETLTTLGDEAFANRTSEPENENLEKVFIPKSLNDVSWTSHPFAGNANLKVVEFEDGITEIAPSLFAECTGIEKIVIPDSVETIENSAFFKCSNLKEVTFGKGVTNIEDYAFCKTGLTQVRLPESLTTLKDDVFSNNTELASVYIPKSLADIGWLNTPFSNDSNLKIVEFEEGITRIPQALFAECTGIEKVIVPDSVETIGKGAFLRCENLQTVYCGENVKYIEQYAFGDCTSLKDVFFAGDILKDSNLKDRFNDNVTIHARISSDAIIYAIDQNQRLKIENYEYRDDESKYLDRNKTQFYVKSESKATGYVNLIINYEFKDCISTKNGMKIKVKLPNVKSVFQDDEKITEPDFKLDEVMGTLSVPVSNQKGTIEITTDVSVMEKSALVYARMSGGSLPNDETIGIIEELGQGGISLNVDEKTAQTNIQYRGIAPRNADVTVYLNGEKIEGFHTNALGEYKGNAELKNVEDGKKYTLMAVCMEDGEEKFVEKTVTYKKNQAILTRFDMYYETHSSHEKVDLLQVEDGHVISYYPKAGYRFAIDFKERKLIDKVYVTSTKNGITHNIEAIWDNDMKCYITQELFNGDGHFVPGELGVFYTEKQEIESLYGKLQKQNEDEIAQQLYIEESERPQNIQNAEVQVLTNDTSEFRAEITLADGTVSEVEQNRIDVSSLQAQAQSVTAYGNRLKSSDVAQGITVAFLTTIKDKGDKIADGRYVYYVYEDKKIKMYTYDPTKEIVETFAISAVDNIFGTSFGDLKEGLEKGDICKLAALYYGNMFGINGTVLENVFRVQAGYCDYYLQYKRIYESNLSEEAKSILYQELDEAFLKIMVSSTLNVVGSYLQDYGIKFVMGGNFALGAAMVVAGLVLEDFTNWYLNKYNGGDVLGEYLKYCLKRLNFLVDPSGYVYEGVITNCLNDVKASVYYKDNEGKEVLWDASNYAQINPIQTDHSGVFAWDVPEGEWRVKFEKEGYETTYTEWMVVPPERTNLYIPMISEKIPEVEWITAMENKVEIGFSQYMNTESIKRIVIQDTEGNNLKYELSYSKNETNADGKTLAKEFVFALDNKKAVVGDTYIVNIPEGVSNYAGKEVAANQLSCVCEEDKDIVTIENVNVAFGDCVKVPIRLDGFENTDILSILSYDKYSVSAELSEMDDSGNTYINISGLMKGESDLLLAIENSSVTKSIHINVQTVSDKNFVLEEDKKELLISDLTIKDMLYTGKPYNFDQMITFKDENEKIIDSEYSIGYAGVLEDGTEYSYTELPPSEPGNYKLIIKVKDSTEKYCGEWEYPFKILKNDEKDKDTSSDEKKTGDNVGETPNNNTDIMVSNTPTDTATNVQQTPVVPTNQNPQPTPVSKGTVLTCETQKCQVVVTSTDSKQPEAAYIGTTNKKATKIVIPDEVVVNGISYKVTSVRKKALKNNKKVKTVILGKNVTNVEKEAFSGCKNLSKITIKGSNLKSVGKNAIKGISKKAVIQCPKKKVNTYKKLFKNKTGFKKSMKIK